MTALEFINATWFVAGVGLFLAAFSQDIRVFRACIGLAALWLVIAAALMFVRG